MSRDPLAEVLGAHRADEIWRDCLPADDGRMAWVYARRCDCGWLGPSDQHDAHLADAVRDFLTSDETVERMRKAVEDELIEWRDAQRFMVCGNGFTVCEKDGQPSPIIRFRTDVGLRVALAAATEARP